MRHVSEILGHPLSTGFHELTDYQRDLRDLGLHNDFIQVLQNKIVKIKLPSLHELKT